MVNAVPQNITNSGEMEAFSVIVTTYFGNNDHREHTCVVMAQNSQLAGHYAILQIANDAASLEWKDCGEVQESNGKFSHCAEAIPLEIFRCDSEQLMATGNFSELFNKDGSKR